MFSCWSGAAREAGQGQFLEQNGLEVAPDGSVWVAGYHAHDIQRFDNTGHLLERRQGHVSGPGEFANLGGVAVENGLLFVADRFNNRIQVFDEVTGDYRYQFGERGGGKATVFNFPRAITVGPDGDLYITDDNDVKRIRTDGTYVRRYPQRPDGKFPGSVGVAVSSTGLLFQTDYNNQRLLVWDAETGQFLSAWGGPGSEPGQFSHPNGVALGPDDTVYVADGGNRRVQRFTQDGVFLGEWTTALEGDGRYAGPGGIVIDSERKLVIIGKPHAIRVFDLAGKFLYQWDWAGSPQDTLLFGFYLAFGRDGTLFVADPNVGIHRYIFGRDGDIKDDPDYRIGREEGVFLWKSSYDGPYQLRVNAGTAANRFSYTVKMVSSQPLLGTIPVLLESGDSLTTTDYSFTLQSNVSTGAQDGIDFTLAPSANALVSIARADMPSPQTTSWGRTKITVITCRLVAARCRTWRAS